MWGKNDKKDYIKSSSDGLRIEIAYIISTNEIKGIVQFSHGIKDLGYFYTEDTDFIIDDLYDVTVLS